MSSSKINPQNLTTGAMLVAMGVVLSFFRIPLTTITEITLTGIPIAAGAYLFGPWTGFLIGALIDVCGYLIKPMGAFFPGFTISAGLAGMIYGLFLYQKWWEPPGSRTHGQPLLRRGRRGLVCRILLAHLLKTVLISLLLNCFWLGVFYGMPFRAVFLGSVPKEAINFPIESCLIYITVKILRTISGRHGNY